MTLTCQHLCPLEEVFSADLDGLLGGAGGTSRTSHRVPLDVLCNWHRCLHEEKEDRRREKEDSEKEREKKKDNWVIERWFSRSVHQYILFVFRGLKFFQVFHILSRLLTNTQMTFYLRSSLTCWELHDKIGTTLTSVSLTGNDSKQPGSLA